MVSEMKIMEERLLRIITANQPENRYDWAKEWKNAGRKVAGVIASVPEEVIWAAGILPIRITGTWSADISKAVAHRGSSTCSYCNHMLQTILDGELDFLDAIVLVDKDQDITRFLDVVDYEKRIKNTKIIHAPFDSSMTNQKYYAAQMRKLAAWLQEISGNEVTEDSLQESISLYNEIREMVTEIYMLQKKEHPALTGAELLGLTTGIQVMDRSFVRDELKELMPYIRERKAPLKNLYPRIMISADSLDNPEYFSLIEGECAIVVDDLDTGRHYFMEMVRDMPDPYLALAERYLYRCYLPRMKDWNTQIPGIVKLAKDFRVDGVIAMPLTWCNPQRFRWPLVKAELEKYDIPSIVIEREYNFTNAGQIKTRSDAFVELL